MIDNCTHIGEYIFLKLKKKNRSILFLANLYIFTDTGLVENWLGSAAYLLWLDIFPNDTIFSATVAEFDLLKIINHIKEKKGH
jgi:hypothetical protein